MIPLSSNSSLDKMVTDAFSRGHLHRGIQEVRNYNPGFNVENIIWSMTRRTRSANVEELLALRSKDIQLFTDIFSVAPTSADEQKYWETIFSVIDKLDDLNNYLAFESPDYYRAIVNAVSSGVGDSHLTRFHQLKISLQKYSLKNGTEDGAQVYADFIKEVIGGQFPNYPDLENIDISSFAVTEERVCPDALHPAYHIKMDLRRTSVGENADFFVKLYARQKARDVDLALLAFAPRVGLATLGKATAATFKLPILVEGTSLAETVVSHAIKDYQGASSSYALVMPFQRLTALPRYLELGLLGMVGPFNVK